MQKILIEVVSMMFITFECYYTEPNTIKLKKKKCVITLLSVVIFHCYHGVMNKVYNKHTIVP